MIEKIMDYWERQEPVTICCKANSISFILNDLLIEDVLPEYGKIKVFFNDSDDYLCIDPAEYNRHEDYDYKFVKSNGDFISFIEEVEPC